MGREIRWGGISLSILLSVLILLSFMLYNKESENIKEDEYYWNEVVVKMEATVTKCSFICFDKSNNHSYEVEAFYIIDGNTYNIKKIIKGNDTPTYEVNQIVDIYVEETTFIDFNRYITDNSGKVMLIICIVSLFILLFFILLHVFKFITIA